MDENYIHYKIVDFIKNSSLCAFRNARNFFSIVKVQRNRISDPSMDAG